jgi:hypothetical protein
MKVIHSSKIEKKSLNENSENEKNHAEILMQNEKDLLMRVSDVLSIIHGGSFKQRRHNLSA